MDRCPKDEPAAKNLVCKKSFTRSREKLDKPGDIHPPPSHQWVKILSIAAGVRHKLLSADFDFHTYLRKFEPFCESEYFHLEP